MPHKELFDLSAIYRVIVDENREGTASIAVSYELCSTYEISEEELNAAARKNTKEKGFCVMTMAEVMAEITGIPDGELQNMCLPMFILTNTLRNNGASVMLYKEYFGELAGRLKSDLYVLPSSIHEVLAIPAGNMKPDGLRDMVCSINASEVSEDEVLSDNVYRYNRREDTLVIA